MTVRILTLLLFAAALAASEATVHWDQPRQVIDGFGASDAWFADDIMQHPARDRLLDLLFDRERGAGLSILRHRVPAQERQYADHAVELDSDDLDFGSRSWIGIRFPDLALEPESALRSVHLQLSAKEDADARTTIAILGQAADDAPAFVPEPRDLSQRTPIAARVEWTVPAWRGGERGAAQRSPDLAPLLREILARPGWRAGQAVVLLMPESSGERKAWAADKGRDQAPELVVELADGSRITSRAAASGDDAEEEGASDATWAARLSAAAVARGCERVWAAAWSPPYAWKTSDDERNGFLERAHYQDYAQHLERFRARHDEISGVALYAISPQNEPGKKPWESCEWQPEDFRDFIRDHLEPTLDPRCRIIAPEETRWNQIPRWYDPIHADPAARAAVDILAGHCYPKSDIDLSYAHYGKPVWMTEWSYDTSAEDRSIANGVKWAHNVHRLLVNAGINAFHHWWLVNFKDKQQGLISATRGPDGDFQVAKRLWTIGNFSRFVRPGWERLEATAEPAALLSLSAFRDPTDGTVAMVAINRSTDTARPLRVAFAGFACDRLVPYRSSSDEDLAAGAAIPAGDGFAADLPPLSVTTFVGRVQQ